MADQTLKIEEGVAATAYAMAKDLWVSKHRDNPTMDDEDFIKLVSSCVGALKGHSASYSWKNTL